MTFRESKVIVHHSVTC